MIMISDVDQNVQESSSIKGIHSSHHLPYLWSKAGAPWLRKVLHKYTYLVPFSSKLTRNLIIMSIIRYFDQNVQ